MCQPVKTLAIRVNTMLKCSSDGSVVQVHLCHWEKHLAGLPHLVVVDRWPATRKRARHSIVVAFS